MNVVYGNKIAKFSHKQVNLKYNYEKRNLRETMNDGGESNTQR